MFGFGKKKTESILVCRSEGPMADEFRKSISTFLRQEFPDHKVVVLSDGLKLETVEVSSK